MTQPTEKQSIEALRRVRAEQERVEAENVRLLLALQRLLDPEPCVVGGEFGKGWDAAMRRVHELVTRELSADWS